MLLMEGLLLATGFTGALAILWLGRRIVAFFATGPRLGIAFGPGAVEALSQEIGKARREVLLLGSTASPGVARALAEAKRNKAAIDALLDRDADPTAFDQQGLAPRPASRPTPAGLLVVVDDATVLFADPCVADGAATGQLIVARGYPELVQTCRLQFAACHPAGQATAAPPPQPAPPPGAAPMPTLAPAAPGYPQPSVVSPPSYPQLAAAPAPQNYSQSTSAVDDLLASVARGASRPEAEEAEADEGSEPPVTRATAELFARLRREVASATGDNDSSERAA